MRFWPRLLALSIVPIFAAALWLGCGVKSQPVPPEYAVPQRIVDLRGGSVPGGIRLAWARPDRYAGGAKMRDLGRFEIFRAEGHGPFQMLAEMPVTDQQRFQQQRRFTYLDSDARLGSKYRYKVFSETLDGYRSQPSNEVEIQRVKPKPPPNPENFVLPAPVPPK